MKLNYKISTCLLAGFVLVSFASCSKNDPESNVDLVGKHQITISPIIDGINTKQDNSVNAGGDGRNVFAAGDKFVVTKIYRTEQPIADFTYNNIVFDCNDNLGWEKEDKDNKIYWTDAKAHTFVGYSAPNTSSGSAVFDFVKNGEIYTGTLGTDQTTPDKIKEEDLLLTYSDTVKANLQGDMVAATLYLKHALAKVKIILTINGFATSNVTYDSQTDVENIKIKNQPLAYEWDQTNDAVKMASGASSDAAVSTWKASTSGSNNEKTFVAYALLVPGQRSFDVTMDVTYPDATADGDVTVNYKAHFDDVVFTSGKRTTLNISLNHESGSILVDAKYNDWKDVSLGSDSDLHKESVYLNSVDLTGEESPKLSTEVDNIDFANWLYTDNGVVKDRYGNTGDKTSPYVIKTAYEFLAFAKEVLNGNTFKDQYVKLATDIYLQPTYKANELVWPGIGNGTNYFDGTFEGNRASINNLVGEPLFNTIGENANIQHLILRTRAERMKDGEGFVSSTNAGLLCATNNGTVMGCTFLGEVHGSAMAGGIAAVNNGSIKACYHQGPVVSDAVVGGLTGNNTGTLRACYHANGKVDGTTCGGISAQNTGEITYSAYDKSTAQNITAVGGCEDTEEYSGYKGFLLKEMQNSSFYLKLNAGVSLSDGIDVIYSQTPGKYPTLSWN